MRRSRRPPPPECLRGSLVLLVRFLNNGCDLPAISSTVTSRGLQRDLVGQRRALRDDLVLGDAVPKRQEDLLPPAHSGRRVRRARTAASSSRRRRGDSTTTPKRLRAMPASILRRRLSPIRSSNSSYQTVRPSSLMERTRQCADNGVLVLAGMRDEDVVLLVGVVRPRRPRRCPPESRKARVRLAQCRQGSRKNLNRRPAPIRVGLRGQP